MIKRHHWRYFILALIGTIFLIWLFFPSSEPEEVYTPPVKDPPFLSVDPSVADSLLGIMSLEEKVAQWFIADIEIESAGQANEILDENAILPAGIFLRSGSLDDQKKLIRSSLLNRKYPLFLGAPELFHLFENSQNMNYHQLMTVTSDTFHHSLIHEVKNIFHQCGFSTLFFAPYSSPDSIRPLLSSVQCNPLTTKWLNEFTEEKFLFGGGKIFRTYDFERDSLLNKDSVLISYQILCDSGMSVMIIDSSYFTWKKKNLYQPTIKDFCEDELDFKGLLVAEAPEHFKESKQFLLLSLNEGVDVIHAGKNFQELYQTALELFKNGQLQEEKLNHNIRKSLLARVWVNEYHPQDTFYVEQDPFRISPFYKSFNRRLTASSALLLKKAGRGIPFVLSQNRDPLLIFFGDEAEYFIHESSHYSSFRKVIRIKKGEELEKIASEHLTRGPGAVLLARESSLTKKDEKYLRDFAAKNKKNTLVSIYLGTPARIDYFDSFNNLIWIPFDNKTGVTVAARCFFNAEEINAVLPFSTNNFKAGSGINTAQSRLQYVAAEEAGFFPDSLRKIEYIMDEAIRNHAFPGGQVLLAIDGKVFYNRSFGHHTYSASPQVNNEHIYDMASVTKVAATTMMAMHFYEQKKYSLDDSLFYYFPDTLKKHLRGQSSIANITFRELLKHGSGLPAGQNIFRMIRFDEENQPFDNYYCDEKSQRFCLSLGDSFYVCKDILDTLWLDMHRIWVESSKPYRYSDANMNLLYTMLRPFTGKQTWDRYLDSVFYKPLGMQNSLFLPVEKGIEKDKIAPTENDRYWRKQLLQGYVHDPTAAIYGGVAGNAGLFSNAQDMGILCQLFLNKGIYGGIRFFDEKTVELFTSTQKGTHRALGFNKQISGSTYGCSHYASSSTYGHTGFTGTAFWVDPEIKFIYVFISNRVHPDPNNKKIIDLGVTRRIHDVVYKLLKKDELEI